MSKRFVVRRDNLRQTRWEDRPPVTLEDGSVRLRIDAFALTSNNITYAAFGEAMNYWGFYPTGDATTGCIPVWGFASVVESRCAGVDVGERFYGFWPIADEAVLQPARVNAGGFFDGAEHRRELHPVYNQYLRCSADPAYVAEREAEQALLRPLFGTSFLIDDFLADNRFFGARIVILSSASSKTAYGTAFCLALRRGATDAVKVIGLTSPGNVAFTRSLGCYDEVLCYDTYPPPWPTSRRSMSTSAAACQCAPQFTSALPTRWPTAARSGEPTGTRSSAATACQARGRCFSSHRIRPRNAPATGARRACRSASPPHGPPSCNR